MSKYSSLSNTAKRRLFDKAVTVTRLPVETSGANRGQIDFDNPVTVATLKGHLQPATAQAQVQAGLEVQDNRNTLWMELSTADITSELFRVTIDSVQYTILSVNRWQSHFEMIVELTDAA